jgi:hypothetical protein
MTPEIGLKLENPVAGSTTVFTATAESTDGAYVEIQVTYPPNSAPPPRHLHPSQDEHFTVLSGRMVGSCGDTDLRWRTSPAMRTGEMFCDLWQVAHDNDWSPTGMQLFEVVSRYGDEFCLC